MSLLVAGHDTGVVRYLPIFDDNGNLIDFSNHVFNDRALSILGINSRSELETESLLTKYPEVAETGHMDNARKAFLTGEIVTEDPVAAPWFNKFLRITMFRNPVDGSLYVCYSDVTGRENTKLQAVAQSKLMSLGELAGGVAHELNTPLQVIAGKTRKLKREIDTENEHLVETVNQIDKTLLSVRDIIRNLKTITSHANEPSKEFDLLPVVEEAIGFYSERAKKNSISLEVIHGEYEEIRVFANPTALFQIISNLITNAIDALMLIDPPRNIQVSVAVEKDYVVIEVGDNAEMIPTEVASDIFSPLFTTKEVGKGTGLGLSLASKLASNFGGKLSLVQNERKYFKLEIPKYERIED